MTEVKSPKKLIEVALPLDDINEESAREKQPFTRNHPRSMHIWWARRPFVTARAILFAQLVNDPGYQQDGGFKYGVNKRDAEAKRAKLFDIIRDLVKWENTNNEEVLERARAAIWESWREVCHLNRNHPQAAELFNPDKLPASHDPFAGGGAIPLEAQRLGLESYASDLNPVAVMINKAMIEIPPRFAGRAPVGPIPADEQQKTKDAFQDWAGAQGLAEDVRRYGHWMREQAFARIGHLYPKVGITPEMVAERPDLKAYEGEELTVIAWLWARTVKSPNPVFSHVDVPLVSTFVLSSKKGKEAWVEPLVDGDTYHFAIRTDTPSDAAKRGTTAGKRAGFNCLLSETPMDYNYIRAEGAAGRMRQRLMAIVAEGTRGRVYLSPTAEMEEVASQAKPQWKPETPLHGKCRVNVSNYGFDVYGDLFTPRQLVALTTFSDLVQEAKQQAMADAVQAGMPDDGKGLAEGGTGATAYAEAVMVYLSLATSRWSDMSNAMASWNSTNQNIRALFARQAIPMNWDFAELSPFSKVGPWSSCVDSIFNLFINLNSKPNGFVAQQDAATQLISQDKVISTDPPYYDNIGYADLSDFFYVWMRRSLRSVYPELFATMAVPKAEELVATPYRHGSKEAAEGFFLDGMTQAMSNLAEQAHPAFPVSIYYAFKQSETKEGSTTSTGWVTFLEAVIQAGFAIVGTWPVRTEREGRSIGIGSNALASSIVLVCRKRDARADSISRRDFQRELREQMPEPLETMLGGEGGHAPIAPVDLAQSAIGPGMAIYSKYAQVLNQDGSRMSVHDALIMINRAIDEYLNPEGGSFDADTQFCASWFEQYGWSSGPFGEADTLARAKGTSVAGVVQAGVVESAAGKARLLKWAEYEADWDPTQDDRTPIWEACHYMIRRLNNRGESAAGELLAKMPEHGESIRQLAYHLYTLCERKKWAEEARAYNELILSWNAIVAASMEAGHSGEQGGLDF